MEALRTWLHVLVGVLSNALSRPITVDDVGYGEVPAENVDDTLEYPETISDSVTTLTRLGGGRPAPERAGGRAARGVPAAVSDLLVE